MSPKSAKGLVFLSGLWILLAIPLAAGTARIYVNNKGGTTFDVIDPETNKVVAVISNIESPEVARFSPDGSRIYITSGGENVLDVMDQKSGKIIKKVPLSGYANDAAVTNDGKLVLVCIRNTGLAREDAGALDVVDTASLERIKSIPVSTGLHDVAITADNKYAAAGSPGRFLVVFDLKSMEIAWQVQYDQSVNPLTIESNPDGSARRIFVQLGHTNGFSVVDFAKHEEVARIKLPDEPGGFPAPTNGISHGIGIAPDGKTLWVNSRPANAVFVYSLPELKPLGHVSMPELKLPGKTHHGGSPQWLTFTPDGKTVYISSRALGTVSAIDAKTMKVVATIPVGQSPDRVSTLVLP